jgi:two-component system cell cycle sensor histidine kinase/response regulator CckA
VIDPTLLRREVLDRIGAGVVIVDPRTRLIEWTNPTASVLFGTPVDAIVGARCQDCFLCSAEEGACPVLDQGHEVDNAERVLMRGDGSQLTVMKSVQRISLDGQEKLLETFIDISERKRAEAVRRESEDRYRVLFENSREAMMVLAPPAWNFVAANAATLELFGVKDEATFLSLGPWNVSPATQPDGRPSADKALEMIKIAMVEGAHAFEWRHQRLDGREIPASVQLTRLEFAGQSLLQATVRDLSPTERALSALRDSEEQLEKIFNHSSNAMSLTELTGGKVLNVNEAWVRGSGISRLDAIGKSTAELGLWIGWDDCDACYQVLEREGRLHEFETELVLKGVARQFVVNAEFVELRRGRFLLWEFRDITERKRAQETLSRYELLASHSRDVVLFVRRDDGRILDANAAALSTYGYSRDELLSLSIRELRPPDTRILTEEQMAIADSRGILFETVHRRKDGSTLPVEVSSGGATIGGVRMLMSVVRDITERKRAESALRDSEEQLESIFNNSTNGLAFTESVSGKILKVNDTWVRDTGISRGDAVGKSALALNMWAHEHQREAALAELGREGRLRDFEATLAFRGVERQLAINADFVDLHRGRYLLWELRDITSRKVAEKEKAKLTGQLQQAQKMESVGRLAGGVAHDFNNMLGVILGHAELALERVDSAGPLHNDLVNIQSAAQRSADLTRQLLAFARKQTVAPKALNLNDTVAGMLKMARRLIGEDIQLEWRPGENLCLVNIDPTQIDQILANLCVNARDAIANVGKITIETGNKVIDAELAAATVGMVPGDYVWLAVGDDGCGMDPATLSHAFEPFFTTKEVGKGTGLGLATVYGIVKQNNGFIDAHSELGKGTVFTIYLPRHVGKTVPARLDRATGTVEPGRETILLVEDETSLLEITQRMLGKHGYRVLTASTPGQAIQLAREHAGTIDLLITDVVMPEMNGRDLAKNILSLYPQTKRLFMSGYTADVIAHQGVLDEGVFFIQKPFSAQDLAAMVRKVLEHPEG